MDQLHHGLGDDPEGALAATEQAGQVVAGAVGQGPGGDHAAVHGDELDAQDMIGGDAVEQGVGAAGVGGDVAAQGAGVLAGRVGGVVKAVAMGVGAEVGVDDAGFHDRAAVAGIDFEDAVHAGGGDHHAAAARNGPAAEPGPRAARHDWHAVLQRRLDDHLHLGRAVGEHHGVRQGAVDRAVVLVQQQVVGI